MQTTSRTAEAGFSGRSLESCNFRAPRLGRQQVFLVQSYSLFGGSDSKCPVARLVNGGKPAEALIEEARLSASSPRFAVQDYNYVPFTAPSYQSRYKMTMGLTPMDPKEWVEIDEYYEEEMALRRQLIKENREVVIASSPGAEAANREMLELLAEFLPQRYPDRFSRINSLLINHSTQEEWDLNDPNLDPLEVSALLVQEDLCLMQLDEQGTLRFVSGAVLFPQRWSLLEKLGMDMHRIHEPVPLYEREIQRPVDGFMMRLATGKPFTRANWTITDNPILFQPLEEDIIRKATGGANVNLDWIQEEGEVTTENAGQRLSTRCERETLSRFPKTQAILFTIRTHIRTLDHYAQHPERAFELARALRNLHPDVKRYKTIAAFEPQALEFLDGVAERTGTVVPEPAPVA